MHISSQTLHQFPARLLQALAAQGLYRQAPVFFSGGVARDWLLGLRPVDLDITVPDNSYAFAQGLARELDASFVPLAEEEGVARVALGDFHVDVSSFRNGSRTIEEDLGHRDFTINAMAVAFDCRDQSLMRQGQLIDPLSGAEDLAQKVLRAASEEVFIKDPLRLLRAYRFLAVFNFSLEFGTAELIKRQARLIIKTAAERVSAELDKILSLESAAESFRMMAVSGLLFELFPELAQGVGVAQPASHHLDVFDHSLEALAQLENILDDPGKFFPGRDREIASFMGGDRRKIQLKYAALFHDLGKPAAQAVRGGRITFYNHDRIGADLLAQIARRCKWRVKDRNSIVLMVKEHMRPFHLNNARNKTGLTPRACLKLVKAAGRDLIGLFLLAMADSLAGRGQGKPLGMEEAISSLFSELFEIYQRRVGPVLKRPLLNGHDLINNFQLQPGPFLGTILRELEKEQVMRSEMTRTQALEWADNFIFLHK